MVNKTNNSGDAHLLVFADDWGRHPSSCQHLIGQLLPRYDVTWVNTIMRPPRLDRSTLRRGLEKAGQWSGLRQRPAAAASRHGGRKRPLVLNPGMWPWFQSRFARQLNRRLLRRQLARHLRRCDKPIIGITTLPIVGGVMDDLPVSRWVYYCVDDFAEWPGLDGNSLRLLEDQLVEKADVIVAVSEHLKNKLARSRDNVQLLTHGVDIDHWKCDAAACPALDDYQRPLVMFWGLIDRRMDLEMIRTLSARLERGTILLVGPQIDPHPELASLDRVRLIPPVSFDSLPSFGKAADVLIMPYADLPVNHAIQPLKLLEYLSTGKPVVVRDLPSTRPWSDCLHLASTADDFADGVCRALGEGLSAEQQQSRRRRLERESWREKSRRFEGLMATGIEAACR